MFFGLRFQASLSKSSHQTPQIFPFKKEILHPFNHGRPNVTKFWSVYNFLLAVFGSTCVKKNLFFFVEKNCRQGAQYIVRKTPQGIEMITPEMLPKNMTTLINQAASSSAPMVTTAKQHFFVATQNKHAAVTPRFTRICFNLYMD